MCARKSRRARTVVPLLTFSTSLRVAHCILAYWDTGLNTALNPAHRCGWASNCGVPPNCDQIFSDSSQSTHFIWSQIANNPTLSIESFWSTFVKSWKCVELLPKHSCHLAWSCLRCENERRKSSPPPVRSRPSVTLGDLDLKKVFFRKKPLDYSGKQSLFFGKRFPSWVLSYPLVQCLNQSAPETNKEEMKVSKVSLDHIGSSRFEGCFLKGFWTQTIDVINYEGVVISNQRNVFFTAKHQSNVLLKGWKDLSSDVLSQRVLSAIQVNIVYWSNEKNQRQSSSARPNRQQRLPAEDATLRFKVTMIIKFQNQVIEVIKLTSSS